MAHHEYVVVPELGGFVVQMQSARILPDQIIPPLASIGFNPLMHHADGLLAIQIARSEQISYRLAMEYIEKEVANIKLKLNSWGKVRLGNLGMMLLDAQGNMLFQPHEKAGFLPQNLGLTNLYITSRTEKPVREQRTIQVTLPSRGWYKYVAVALMLIGLFAISTRVGDMQRIDQASLASLGFIKSPVVIPDSLLAPADTFHVAEDSMRAEIQDTIPDAVEPQVLKFHVVVASLPTQESARKFCESLFEEKFVSAHVLNPVKTYRVAIKSFAMRDEAISYMENLRGTDPRFESAWVYCN